MYTRHEIIFGSGSEEIIQMICRTFLFPDVNTVMAAPTFPQYKHNAIIEGAEVREIATIDGYHDIDGMLEAIDENTNVVCLCSPNNPTGNPMPKDNVYSIYECMPNEVLVVLDEAYYEYVDPAKDIQAIEHVKQYNNLIVLRTFSKAYGLQASALVME